MYNASGLNYDSRTAPLSQEEIAYLIAIRKNPLTVGWSWTGGGGHVLVTAGYKRLRDGTFLNETYLGHETETGLRLVHVVEQAAEKKERLQGKPAAEVLSSLVQAAKEHNGQPR